ncbi:MAG: hypothetical protein J4F36_09560 [Nitrosopumilaceae archaeon]|nr:hypothetical protein [Nitrosopumilaceae archaeon]
MNKKAVGIAGIVAIFALGMVAASSSFAEVSGETTEKPTVPRYSETCAHGHNGYGCNQPQYRMDITELQQKTVELEQRVYNLERTR